MNTTRLVAVATVIAVISACSEKAAEPAAQPPVADTATAAPVANDTSALADKPMISTTEQSYKSATVTALNTATRELSFKTDDGAVGTVKVSSALENLGDIKVGDILAAQYETVTTYEVRAGQGVRLDKVESEVIVGSEDGEEPGLVKIDEMQATLLIAAIDREAGNITLKNKDGETELEAVNDMSKLKHVKAGDVLIVTKTETIVADIVPQEALSLQ
ncbi:hypothetical protein [Agaribacterium haliotis]|uniref:hypothetical protein n=1 Tax=Agaribacterium haliotis TaxID=2013869 RepID=UPI000BB5663C|nr:hypothetical protein [Agaribacterium haliotis]